MSPPVSYTHLPMWATEYCRDEGLRKYWDEYSYPFHKEGDGPLYKGKPATDYNRNQDELAISMIARWYDYWRERPGTGKMCIRDSFPPTSYQVSKYLLIFLIANRVGLSLIPDIPFYSIPYYRSNHTIPQCRCV